MPLRPCHLALSCTTFVRASTPACCDVEPLEALTLLNEAWSPTIAGTDLIISSPLPPFCYDYSDRPAWPNWQKTVRCKTALTQISHRFERRRDVIVWNILPLDENQVGGAFLSKHFRFRPVLRFHTFKRREHDGADYAWEISKISKIDAWLPLELTNGLGMLDR